MVYQQPVGTNTWSRLALLFSLSEDRSFQIDPYVDTTIDWARTPDGHTYSNKPPGPAFLAFPFYAPIDHFLNRNLESREERDRARLRRGWNTQYLLSLLLQVLPFVFIACLAFSYLPPDVSLVARSVGLLALLLGSTASVFMNNFFGHAMTAWWCLAMCLATLKDRYRWIGFSYGWLCLCDYTMAPLGLVSLAILRGKGFFKIVQGGILPGLLWSLYHWKSFGSPFTLANHFQNPAFVDVQGAGFLGIFHLLPQPRIVFELLFGFWRGILWTQPWVLAALVFGALSWNSKTQFRSRLARFSIASFLILLLINSAFGGWHGGGSPGPRYLSPIFPVMGLLLTCFYDGLSDFWKHLLQLGVGAGVCFTLVVLSIELMPPQERLLWPYYADQLFHHFTPTMLFRLGLGILGLAVGSLYAYISSIKSR